LSEFLVIATRKVVPPLTLAEVERLPTALVHSWTVYDVTTAAVLEAIRAVHLYHLGREVPGPVRADLRAHIAGVTTRRLDTWHGLT
jgi:hypothetical protein